MAEQHESNNGPKVTRRKFLRGAALATAAAVVATLPDNRESQSTILNEVALSNWVSERGWSLLFERNARNQVVTALKQDARDFERGQKTPSWFTLNSGPSLKNRFETLFATKNSSRIVLRRKDNITQEPYDLVIEKRDLNGKTSYSTKELKPNGAIISEATLNGDGSTSLTLQFHGERYKDANPNITRDGRFPRTTLVTANLLLGATG